MKIKIKNNVVTLDEELDENTKEQVIREGKKHFFHAVRVILQNSSKIYCLDNFTFDTDKNDIPTLELDENGFTKK